MWSANFEGLGHSVRPGRGERDGRSLGRPPVAVGRALRDQGRFPGRQTRTGLIGPESQREAALLHRSGRPREAPGNRSRHPGGPRPALDVPSAARDPDRGTSRRGPHRVARPGYSHPGPSPIGPGVASRIGLGADRQTRGNRFGLGPDFADRRTTGPDLGHVFRGGTGKDPWPGRRRQPALVKSRLRVEPTYRLGPAPGRIRAALPGSGRRGLRGEQTGTGATHHRAGKPGFAHRQRDRRLQAPGARLASGCDRNDRPAQSVVMARDDRPDPRALRAPGQPGREVPGAPTATSPGRGHEENVRIRRRAVPGRSGLQGRILRSCSCTQQSE